MCCDFAIGVATAEMIMIVAPIHPIRLGILTNENTPGAQLPLIVF